MNRGHPSRVSPIFLSTRQNENTDGKRPNIIYTKFPYRTFLQTEKTNGNKKNKLERIYNSKLIRIFAHKTVNYMLWIG